MQLLKGGEIIKNLNIIVMGKTGAGKSTIVNTVLNEELAPTGTGSAVTKEIKVYEVERDFHLSNEENVSFKINLYDTVGLEISSDITRKTIEDVKKMVEKAQMQETENDITIVWFCVREGSNRFEKMEQELINLLLSEYAIPFIVVITQSNSQEFGDLEYNIQYLLQDVEIQKILAKEQSLRGGIKIEPFGINDLMECSIKNHRYKKIKLLEKGISQAEKNIIQANENRKNRIASMEIRAKNIIESYCDKAGKIGFIPGINIPIIHGMCIKMIDEITQVFGISTYKGFGEEIFINAVVGLIATPLMCVPVLGAGVCYAYISTAGEQYLGCILDVIHNSTDEELQNIKIVEKRLKEQLNKRK